MAKFSSGRYAGVLRTRATRALRASTSRVSGRIRQCSDPTYETQKKVSAALTDRRVTKNCAISPPNSNKIMCEERVTRLLLARVLPDGRDEAVHAPPNRSGSEARAPPRTVLLGPVLREEAGISPGVSHHGSHRL